jgi:hypothetical protein
MEMRSKRVTSWHELSNNGCAFLCEAGSLCKSGVSRALLAAGMP